MKRIRVLGCSGSMAAGARTTSLLVDDDLLIDAGSGIGDLTLDELGRIDDILLTHSHLDHVLGIPLLADSVRRQRAARGPVRVHGLAPTLQALRDHVLNNVIWPDFTRLPRADAPLLALHPIAVGQTLRFGGDRCIEVLPAPHTVPACGFALLAPASGRWVIVSGDTGPQPELWRKLAQRPLHGVIIEAAFSDDESVLADLSGHLHPESLAAQLALLPTDTQVYITHVKPGEEAAVLRQIRAWRPQQPVTLLHSGFVIEPTPEPATQPATEPARSDRADALTARHA